MKQSIFFYCQNQKVKKDHSDSHEETYEQNPSFFSFWIFLKKRFLCNLCSVFLIGCLFTYFITFMVITSNNYTANQCLWCFCLSYLNKNLELKHNTIHVEIPWALKNLEMRNWNLLLFLFHFRYSHYCRLGHVACDLISNISQFKIVNTTIIGILKSKVGKTLFVHLCCCCCCCCCCRPSVVVGR